MCGELFKAMAGIDMVHVPYRSSFLICSADRCRSRLVPISQTIEYVRTAKLRALAVTAAMRQPMLQDTPTVAEFVPGYQASGWYGIGAPKNTAAEIVNSLNMEINGSLADPKMAAQLADIGAVPMPMTPAELGKFIADETEKWDKVIRAANIKPE